VSAHGAGRGRLSTHVLDLARGAPAAGVAVELRRLYSDGSGEILEVTRTNADGRTDEPLREAGKLERGTYEIVFALGDYLREQGADRSTLFLDEVPVRFQVTEPDADHHVPLLFTPFAYQVYRGS
jgi:5-hydroxyisourate hydrolase